MSDAAVMHAPGAAPHDEHRGMAIDPQLALAIVAGVTLLVGQVLTWTRGAGDAPGAALLWVSLIAGGVFGVKAAWDAILARSLNIDILMVVGAGLSAFIGHPAEGALLLFMFTLAGALEHRALAKAKDAVSRLNKLMPAAALVLDPASGQWKAIRPEELKAGDSLMIKPGETIPADAVVEEGRGDIDQSTLTGESLPRSVEPGDEVFAGTINQNGSLRARVSRAIGESSLKRILQLVIEAQERRQPMQRMIDRFSTPYTASVFVAALAALAWYLLGQHESWQDATYHAITLLIVASPCALVIATPTVTLCGLSRAARSGLLVKGGETLERLAAVRTIALDKTGTLTMGKISVKGVTAIGGDETELLALAAGVESHSTHPIAQAIVAYAAARKVAPTDVSDVQNMPGLGLEARSGDVVVRVGKSEYIKAVCSAEVGRLADEGAAAVRQDAALCAVLGSSKGALVISLSDLPRPGAELLVAELHALGISRVAMLTGDHQSIAGKVAKRVGIDIVHAALLPEQKVQKMHELKEMTGAGALAMVGDGVNDAPAMAVADVGLAMGGIGAGATLEAADVVVLHDDLNRIPWAFKLARRVRKVMLLNLTIAVSVIAVLALLAFLKMVPLGLGVVGHEGSTLVVVAISLTVLAFRGPGAGVGAAQK